MIDKLFRPFRNDLAEFIEEGCAIAPEQAKLGTNIVIHSFTGLFLSQILKGEVDKLYDLIVMKKDDKVSETIGNLIIRCRNEFDRHLDLHPQQSRYMSLYLVNYTIDQIRNQYEGTYAIRNHHTFRQYLMKAA